MTPDSRHRWTPADIPDQTGRTVLVTGANAGLGLSTTAALTARGARVIMACRDRDRAAAARDGLPPAARERAEIRPLDLADLDSVHALADSLSGEPIDVLVNNAGVMNIPFGRTAQGHEMQFGTNVLGHFVLTGRLRSQLTDRVVWMGSQAHRLGYLDPSDLDWAARRYRPMPAYAASKAACLVLAYEQQRRFVRAGSTLRSMAAHPGYTATTLMRHSENPLVDQVMRLGSRIPGLSMTPQEGAGPTLFAATEPDLAGGSYIGPDGPGQLGGAPRPVVSTALTYDRRLGADLWRACEELAAG